MNDIIFQALKLVVMIAIVLVVRYVVPLVKRLIDTDKMEVIAQWAEQAVLYAQQVYQSSTGAEKKAIVTQFLREILTAKNISITDEQLDVLIEAAVKSMKMMEDSGITLEPVEIGAAAEPLPGIKINEEPEIGKAE